MNKYGYNNNNGDAPVAQLNLWAERDRVPAGASVRDVLPYPTVYLKWPILKNDYLNQ